MNGSFEAFMVILDMDRRRLPSFDALWKSPLSFVFILVGLLTGTVPAIVGGDEGRSLSISA